MPPSTRTLMRWLDRNRPGPLVGYALGTFALAVSAALGTLACTVLLGPGGDWPMEFRVLGELSPPPGTQNPSEWIGRKPTASAVGQEASVVVRGEYVLLCFNYGYDARATRDGSTFVLRIETRTAGGLCLTLAVRVAYEAVFLRVPQGNYTVQVFHDGAKVYRGMVEVE